MDSKTERQDRIENQLEQGHSIAEAVGRVRAEEAGYTPRPSHGVDKPSTVGFDRPGSKRAA